MVRDGFSLIVMASAGLLPVAVHARLEAGSMWSADSATARAALVEAAPAHLDAPPAAQPGPHRIKRARDGMFYLVAQVNGKPTRFLIDTGASMTVLSKRDAVAAGIPEDEIRYEQSVRTVSGEARIAPVSIDRLQVGEREIRDLDAAIVEEGVGVSLLGQNALGRMDSLSIEGDQLTLR